MAVMVDESPAQESNGLLDKFLALDTPEGLRAELIGGEIVVSPPPGSRHERNMARINRQVTLRSSTAFDFSGNMGLVLPGDGGLPSYVIPDGTFAPPPRPGRLRQRRFVVGAGRHRHGRRSDVLETGA